jgi:MoxR-like ATPase
MAKIKEMALELINEARVVELHIKINDQEARKITGRTHKAFARVLRLANRRKNIALIGPAGCGKTYLAAQVAEALGLKYNTISCSGGMSESKLTGGLLPIGEGGKFEVYMTDLLYRFRDGGVFLADEWDAADANVVLVVNQMLANGHIDLPILGTLKRHKDFIFIASMNTYGTGANRMYVGRNQMDDATMDRFRVGQVEMDYDVDLEKELVKSEVLLKACWKVRDAIQKNKLRRTMSTRYIIDAADMLADGSTLDEELKIFISGWSTDEASKVGLAHLQ